MKYMLIMQATRAEWGSFETLAPAEIHAHVQFMKTLNEDLAKRGELCDAQGLAPPERTRIVTARAGAQPEVSDGPFAETKEFLAGYWIVDVESPDRAYQIAARASSAPGPGGVPLVIPIEVREVMAGPPPTDS